ncbi:MAG: thiamine-phosphate kinase [Ghiorsea sp.]|nr:thiamine-phosphate kinase [Ghiorsea sp.]
MNHEFDAISRLFQQRTPFQHPTTQVGNGDDASTHIIPDGFELVVSTDTAVEAVHWPQDMPLNIAGNRAIHAALSDLAAMGATPTWLWLAIMAKDAASLSSMSDGIVQACLTHNVELAGGDTVRSNTNTINVTVGGLLPKGKAMLRTHAQVADDVWLLGNTGFAAAGLKQWFKGDEKGCFVPYFQHIKPLYQQGIVLRELGIRCCIDISDGLLQDAGHIAKSSALGLHIDLAHIQNLACYQQLLPHFDEETCLKKVLSGGEDYALLCTAPASQQQALQDMHAQHIGTCVKGEGVHLIHKGKTVDYNIKGYDHFA